MRRSSQFDGAGIAQILRLITKLNAHVTAEDMTYTSKRFRIDRIFSITAHRKKFKLPREREFDEGYLRNCCQFMWPGQLQTVRFALMGPSVQAILDRLPTARVIDMQNGFPIIEAEVFGDGIRMFLLFQGA